MILVTPVGFGVMPTSSGDLSPSQARHLEEAAVRRRAAHSVAEAKWVRSIEGLVNAGVSVTSIARHLRVSRQAVYDWLTKAAAAS